jgi:PAS domain S-box-containing protein
MINFQNISLKNKIFIATLAVILLISVLIALFTRWTLISSLTSELKRRGIGIAESIAESSRTFILTENYPGLTSLVFDSRLGERKELVVYVYILNKQREVLAHSFTTRFPPHLRQANPITAGSDNPIVLLQADDVMAYDIAVPVREGIYQIGSVHVGLNKNHIDSLIAKLRTTFLGFVSVVTVIFFAISHWLSKYITRPISELTQISDEISKGHFAIPSSFKAHTGGAGDEVRQLAASFINMTNHIQRSQAQLTESEGKYRSLFASGPNPIFVIDFENLDILDANPSAEETYGYQHSELVKMRISDLGPFEKEDDVTGGRLEDAWRNSCVVNSKVQYFRKGQIPIYVNVHASPTQYQDRKAMIVATTDISEMVEKDSQLIQASKMTTLGEMSAGIAHELNQPLNAIKMGSEFLKVMIDKHKRIPEQNLYKVVGEVSEQVDRAAEIITRLRDFGRKADFTMEPVYIHRPVKGVLDMLGKQLRLQNIAIELDLDESIPPILAHNNRLEQVVFNLITNARDAINQHQESDNGSKPKVIRIKSYREMDRVALMVADTGVGIPAAVRERIFDAFFTTKKMGEGMGLGLSISSGIVGDYNGDIHIESQEGQGTAIILTFPSIT